MAYAIVFNEGVKGLLDATNLGTGISITVGLFKTALSLTRGSVLADFVAATYTGYAGVAWNTIPVSIDASGRAVWPQKVVTFNGPGAGTQDVYGFYVYDPFQSFALFGDSFAAPRTQGPGSVITLTLDFRAYDARH